MSDTEPENNKSRLELKSTPKKLPTWKSAIADRMSRSRAGQFCIRYLLRIIKIIEDTLLWSYPRGIYYRYLLAEWSLSIAIYF